MVDREAQHEASASLSALWLIDFQHGSDYQHFGFNGEANVLQNLATKPPPEIDGCTFEILAILGHVETPHWSWKTVISHAKLSLSSWPHL
jgi:hypothetical protein